MSGNSKNNSMQFPPPVILVHGMASSKDSWEKLFLFLNQSGYPAYSIDLLGHGESEKPNEEDQYQFRRIFDHFAREIESLHLTTPVVLVGHSLGGYLSLAYAARYQEHIRGLVLIDPFFSSSQIHPFVNHFYQRPHILEKIFQAAPAWLVQLTVSLDLKANPLFMKGISRQMALDYKRASPKIAYILRTLPDLILENIVPPTIVLWGEHDTTLLPASFRTLVQALPNAVGYPIPGCGHHPHLTKPELVDHKILSFLHSIR